jgi:hypothetical protein
VQFEFAVESRYKPLLLAFGVREGAAWLRIDGDDLEVKFGFFGLSTTVGNVTGYQLSGDYKAYRAIGIRTSLKDRGVTFGSTTSRGLCVTFADPVPVKPGIGLEHPGMTVTVDDVDGLAAEFERRGIDRSDA